MSHIRQKHPHMKYTIYVLVAINIAFLVAALLQVRSENRALKGFIKDTVENQATPYIGDGSA